MVSATPKEKKNNISSLIRPRGRHHVGWKSNRYGFGGKFEFRREIPGKCHFLFLADCATNDKGFSLVKDAQWS
jgi:hypothetical protein